MFLTLVWRTTARYPVRSSPPSLRRGLRAYATTHDRVHPHHLPPKPSVFGQPTSKSHPHLGEHARPRSPPPLLLADNGCVRVRSEAGGGHSGYSSFGV